MPSPPSNPISMLRKLGTNLVGQDGLLTNAAAVALGYSPMDRIKNRLAAQSEVQGQVKFQQEMDAANRKAEADRLALETQTYNLGRAKTTDTRSDAERAARGAVLADATGAATPDEAIGKVAGQHDLNVLHASDPTTVLSPEAAAVIGGTPGQRMDDKELSLLVTAANVKAATEARKQAAHDAAAARADARNQMSTYQTAQVNNSIADDYRKEMAPLIVVTNAARRAKTLSDYIQTHPEASGIASEAVVADWERMLDPMSVIREGEFTRALAGTPYSARAEVVAQRIVGNGGHLTPDLVKEFVGLIQVAAQYSRQRGSERYDAYKSLLKGDTRLIGNNPFNEGFDAPAGVPSTPGSNPNYQGPVRTFPAPPGFPPPGAPNDLLNRLNSKFPVR